MITFYYNPTQNWIAESYYYLNTIKTLAVLPEHRQPEILVFVPDDLHTSDLLNTGYSKMTIITRNDMFSFSLFARLKYKLSGVLPKSKGFKTYGSDFGYFSYGSFSAVERFCLEGFKPVIWIPDFQEIHFPEFFSVEDIQFREQLQQKFVSAGLPLVFSSNSALMDFRKKYATAKNSCFVYQFSSLLPDFSDVSVSGVMAKYGINEPYFFAPNQFWQHKNQLFILETILELREQGIKPLVVFTGKNTDYRSGDYASLINDFVEHHNLSDQIRVLGFIDRKDQLVLMRKSISVIQPSLFEGWSTVVEDAKSLNIPILLSSIDVHLEQLPGYSGFFDPRSHSSLKSQLMRVLDSGLPSPDIDYKSHVNRSAEQFISIFENI